MHFKLFSYLNNERSYLIENNQSKTNNITKHTIKTENNTFDSFYIKHTKIPHDTQKYL